MTDTADPNGTRTSSRFRAWLAVLSIAMAAFVVITTEFLPVGLLATIAADTHVSVGTAGLMIALPGLIAAIAAPAAAMFANNHDRKHLLIGFAALVMVSNVLVALSSSFGMILLARSLLGVSVGGFWTFAVAAARKFVPEASGARATTMVISAVSIGTVVGVPVSTALGTLYGWRFAFVSVAALAALTALAQFLLLSPLPSPEPVSLHSMMRLFKIPPMRFGFIASALTASGHFAAYTYLQPLLSERFGLSPTRVIWVLVAYGVAGIFGTFIAEHTTSRDLRRTFIGVALVMGLAIAIAACGVRPSVGMCAVVLWGAAFGAVPICTQIWTFRSAPERFEPASAMGMTVFQIALSVGSLCGGRLFNYGGIVPAYSFAAILSLSCAALLLFAPSPDKA